MEVFYKSINKIRYKNLDNSLITFGHSGFKHLLTKNRKERAINEQFRKLSLLKYLLEVINSDNPIIDKRILSSKEYGSIEYVSIVKHIDNRNIKVILRKLGGGNYHFWSIMDY